MNASISAKVIHDNQYYVLAFERQKHKYPKPGTLIAMSSYLIEQHVKEIESYRDPIAKANYPIQSKFTQINQLQTLFVMNPIEQKLNIKTDVPVWITELDSSNKAAIYAKCDLSMLNWPADVPEENRCMWIDCNDAIAINPVLCSTEWTYQLQKPDNITTFGFKLKDRDVYQTFTALSKDVISTAELPKLITSLGIKEYSNIISPPKIVQQRIEHIDDIVEQSIYQDEDATNTLLEEIFDSHPLAKLSSFLYETVLQTMNAYKLPTDDDFRVDLMNRFKSIISSADIDVDFDDSH